MRVMIALAVVLALSSGANAYCPSFPDNARTGYTQNGVNRAVCLEDDLARAQAERAYQTQLDTKLEQLRRDTLQQEMQLRQLQTFDPPIYRPPGL